MSRPPSFRLKPPRLRLSENDVESACLDLLRLRGYWVARLHAGMFKSADGVRWIKGVDKGTPDYALLHRQHPGFLLEVKRPGEKPKPVQDYKHSEIRMGYRLAIGVVDSVEGLAVWLDEHERNARQSWTQFINASSKNSDRTR